MTSFQVNYEREVLETPKLGERQTQSSLSRKLSFLGIKLFTLSHLNFGCPIDFHTLLERGSHGTSGPVSSDFRHPSFSIAALQTHSKLFLSHWTSQKWVDISFDRKESHGRTTRSMVAPLRKDGFTELVFLPDTDLFQLFRSPRYSELADGRMGLRSR